MSLKVFVDPNSPPCRAILLFLQLTDTPHQVELVVMARGEHKSPAFRNNINAWGQIPAMVDGEFNLKESVAILHYLATQPGVADHWYPADRRQRAKVDEFLLWLNTSGLRTSSTFHQMIVQPRLTRTPLTSEKAEQAVQNIQRYHEHIENYFLKDADYLAGSDVSIADLVGAAEIMQDVAIGCPVLRGRPKLAAWLERVKTRLQPRFDSIHEPILERLKGQREDFEAKGYFGATAK